MPVEQFDAVIIGAGQSGGPLSTALGEAGWKTAIIEREHVGGTCINEGCTPTKTMVASARIAHLVGRAGDYGVEAGKPVVDLSVVRKRKREIVESFRSGSQARIEAAPKVELIFGEASFVDSHTVSVEMDSGSKRTLHASTIVINAGGRPRIPGVPGLAEIGPLDSTSIMDRAEVPGRLLILGGGAIGLEFGQMFCRFGSEVTILERGSRLLAREDEEISEAIAEILAADGIHVTFNADLREVRRDGDNKHASVEKNGNLELVEFDEILVAAGRLPNTEALNLAAAGVETDERGYIVVDDRLKTNVDGIYALGDINGGPAFTHVSYDDFRIMRANLLEDAGLTRRDRMLPYTIFVDPQLGRIGLTEHQARQAGIDVLVFRMPMSYVARALEVDETRGLMKAVVNRSTGEIVGASILGIEGGEIAGAIQIAMMGGLSYTDLRDGVFSHPTLTEALNNLFASPVEE